MLLFTFRMSFLNFAYSKALINSLGHDNEKMKNKDKTKKKLMILFIGSLICQKNAI